MLKSASVLPGVVYLSLALVSPAHAQARPSVPPASREVGVTTHATGTFDVKVAPVASDTAEGTPLGRFSLDKQYHGALEAAGKGEMLTAGNAASGSAGYVAIERVSGTLGGR